MTSTALRACPVCQERQVEQLHTQKFVIPEACPLGDRQTIVCCSRCGSVYADIASTQQDYNDFYSNLSRYEDAANSTGSGETAIDSERLGRTAEILSDFLPSKDARILDIGCAGGGLLSALRRLGYDNLAGLDPSEVCVRRASRNGVAGYQGWATNLPPNMGTFDCITVSHVLEHIVDVPSAVENLRLLLRDGGLLYIEVPDANRYAEYVYAPFQDFNLEHINHFSAQSVDNLLLLHGFSSTAHGERLLKPSAHTFTPSIYGLFRRSESRSDISPDRELKSSILRYIGRSSALLNAINRSIDEVLRDSPELIVWGTGQLALKLLAESSLSRAKLVAFVDSNPVYYGRTLAGIPILSPSAIREFPHPILIATLLHQREISAQARQLGLTNELILLPEGMLATPTAN